VDRLLFVAVGCLAVATALTVALAFFILQAGAPAVGPPPEERSLAK